MAESYRFIQQTGNLFYLQHTPKNSAQHDTLVPSLPSQFLREPPSPFKSLDLATSRGHSSQGMYTQGHQQGHTSRLNGNPGGRGAMPVMYGYQQSGGHQHVQRHQVMQPDHASHSATSSALGHHSAFSSSVLSNASPYSNGLPNGHSRASHATQGPPLNDHWALQLALQKEAEAANVAMVEQGQVNYYARLKAAENKGIGGPSPTTNNAASGAGDDETEDMRRPTAIEKPNERQDWHNLDLSGQGLRALSPALFRYNFLVEMYIGSNRLTSLPPAIGELRQLRHLEASYNQISELPPELGMCTFLKRLLLFNNQLRTLPCELGSLHLLEVLGIEGNPLEPELKNEIMERGTKSLITFLREQSPGEWFPFSLLSSSNPPPLSLSISLSLF